MDWVEWIEVKPTTLPHADSLSLLCLMKISHRIAVLSLLSISGGLGWAGVTAPGLQTRNVVLVTIDGLRWQEVFRGADAELMTPDAGRVGATERGALLTKFGGDIPGTRRAKLMPFLWDVVARQGQVWGNRDAGSPVEVSNAHWFSYPGYNELLTGRPDPGIISNDPIPNPNISVLEWLNQRPAFTGRVAACAAWQVFPAILNSGRSGLPLWITGQHSAPATTSPAVLELESLMNDIPSPWPDEHYDAFVARRALEYIAADQPRVLYVALGEPDDWAHGRQYDRYLASIANADRFIRRLWDKLQSLPQYRGTTTLIISPDHGRGRTAKDWTDHGAKTPGSNETWLAVLGPDTPPLGERRETPVANQAQIAATVAALLGEDYRKFQPAAAPALAVLAEQAPR